MGEALDHDSRGRALPAWQGCRVVAGDEGLPDELAVRGLGSFDGRYFGPPPGAAAGGMTSLLWPCFSSPQVL